MAGFTKGPWDWSFQPDENGYDTQEIYITESEKSHELCRIDLEMTQVHSRHYIPNAHLIAAAPDMYEALSLLLSQCENVFAKKLDDPSRMAEFGGVFLAKAALKKARGE